MNTTNQREIEHFTKLKNIWWGAETYAGQKRYDLKAKAFYKFCKPNKDTKILEIGCGDGEFTKRIIRYSDSITAADITPEVIRRAKTNRTRNKVKFVVDNSEKMRFKPNTFGIVCGISILHHVDTQKVLNECFKVLKKGGRLFFTEPNLLNPIIYLGQKIPFLRKSMGLSPDEVAFRRQDLIKMLQKSKFRNIEVYNYDFLHPHTPRSLAGIMILLSRLLEKTPLLKEISGSFIVYAEK